MENNETFQTSERSVQTCIPSAIEISVREVDWHRIYRSVKGIPSSTSWYVVCSSFFVGISASGVISLIALFQTELGDQSWVKWATFSATVISLLLGWIFHNFGSKHDKLIKFSTVAVEKDMEDIYSTFFPNKNLPNEAGVSANNSNLNGPQ